MHGLAFLPEALAEWNALDKGVRSQFRKALEKRLKSPVVESARLRGDLRECFKIKLQSSGHRLVYTIENDQLVVIVVAIGKRDNLAVYKASTKRLS
ncbi:mRNA interferase RelE [mine drainage metagenome]|uniref:mRNA interferase RelE n=1 Tax=mine drainage metagenome TaxID=410659 RepID=A0A1J5R1H1_9ZZZZ